MVLAEHRVHQVLLCDDVARSRSMGDDEFEERGATLDQQRKELGRMLAQGRADRIYPALHGFMHLCGLGVNFPSEEAKDTAPIYCSTLSAHWTNCLLANRAKWCFQRTSPSLTDRFLTAIWHAARQPLSRGPAADPDADQVTPSA